MKGSIRTERGQGDKGEAESRNPSVAANLKEPLSQGTPGVGPGGAGPAAEPLEAGKRDLGLPFHMQGGSTRASGGSGLLLQG